MKAPHPRQGTDFVLHLGVERLWLCLLLALGAFLLRRPRSPVGEAREEAGPWRPLSRPGLASLPGAWCRAG
ncbi:MAG: hypothetical protein K2W96_19240, partial [Gemmataceae bacterium]|nr:hypothetical protein [Gemmataceae bacterium]